MGTTELRIQQPELFKTEPYVYLPPEQPKPCAPQCCAKCGGDRLMAERTPDGPEWHCVYCGKVSYGVGFRPLVEPDDDEDTKQRRRRPVTHGGMRL